MGVDREEAIAAAVDERLQAFLALFDGPAGRVLRERLRQIEKGYDADHDAAHPDYALPSAAMAYLGVGTASVYRSFWPFDLADFSPSDDPLDNLIVGAALALAAIERLMRQRGLMEDDDAPT